LLHFTYTPNIYIKKTYDTVIFINCNTSWFNG